MKTQSKQIVFLQNNKSLINNDMLNRVTVKSSKLTNGVRVERGMSVDVVTNPITTNGGQAVADAFMRI